MRFELIIAAVTRSLAIARTREILAVDTFAVAIRLHSWLLRTSLGMPSYPGPDLMSLNDVRRDSLGEPGCKRGRQQYQLALVSAGQPAGSASA